MYSPTMQNEQPIGHYNFLFYVQKMKKKENVLHTGCLKIYFMFPWCYNQEDPHQYKTMLKCDNLRKSVRK